MSWTPSRRRGETDDRRRPVGILLSGGLDSSLVTAMASRVSSQPVKTFTISFPATRSLNEAPFARMVAEHFGTRITPRCRRRRPASSCCPKLAWQYDEPIGDSSMVPTYIVSRLIREHATVALGGDGGDELFGGYHLYTWSARLGLRAAVSCRAVAQPGPKRRAPPPVRDAWPQLSDRRLGPRASSRSHSLGLYWRRPPPRASVHSDNGTHPTPTRSACRHR